MPLSPVAERELFNDLLKQVSRSFYLTLRALPLSIRRQIGLAYLLARATDTIADTEIVPVASRLDALNRLRAAIDGERSSSLQLGAFAGSHCLPAERVLLERISELIALLDSFQPDDVKCIRAVLATITSGQELDLRRFDGASASNVIALRDDVELDDYTYRVAGCVGKFWTEMCVEHQFADLEIIGIEHLTSPWFMELGVRFGKGLQLVNILRDLPADLRKGRCYVPADKLAQAGLSPADLLSPANESKFRPLYARYLDLATEHLAAGWRYTLLIPAGQVRLRMACALPILIGLETIRKLSAESVLEPSRRVKISRQQIRRIMAAVVLKYPFQSAWRRLGPRVES